LEPVGRRRRIIIMSTETRELVELCERLPAAQRAEVADFARFLVARNAGAAPPKANAPPSPAARGAAKPGVTTDEVMTLTRGEP
jgi:hypothetical protein